MALALVAGAALAQDVVLVSPRTGDTLRAGELARVSWAAGGPGAAAVPPDDAGEWEVFLSLDGGRTHPIRLTPHLGGARREFDFLVPSTPTDDARLLLRFGDERTETEVELAARFAIVGSAVEPATARAFAAGEAARQGEPGVVLWAEGSRDGAAVREVEYSELPARFSPYSFAVPGTLPAAVRANAPRLSQQGATVSARRFAATAVRAASATAEVSTADLRLRIHRFNE